MSPEYIFGAHETELTCIFHQLHTELKYLSILKRVKILKFHSKSFRNFGLLTKITGIVFKQRFNNLGKKIIINLVDNVIGPPSVDMKQSSLKENYMIMVS